VRRYFRRLEDPRRWKVDYRERVQDTPRRRKAIRFNIHAGALHLSSAAICSGLPSLWKCSSGYLVAELLSSEGRRQIAKCAFFLTNVGRRQNFRKTINPMKGCEALPCARYPRLSIAPKS
jgi:hypothetical protein